MNKVVLLSGPVGAGKSTVAKELVALTPGKTACIEGDIFWSFVAKVEQTGDRNDLFRTIMRSMLAAALPFARSGYEALVDFSIPPWFLSTAESVASPRNITLDYVIVRPSESVCAARAAARLEGRIEQYDKYRDLYYSFDGYSRFAIEDNDATPAQIASSIRSGLDAGKFRVVEQ